MDLRRIRSGEAVTLVSAVALAVCTFLPWYRRAGVDLTAWNTFGAVNVLIVIAVLLGLGLVAAALTEHSTALPVAAAIWTTPWALAAAVGVLVRLIDRPEHTGLRAFAWLALLFALGLFAGAWQTFRDDHRDLYEPASPPVRPAPQA